MAPSSSAAIISSNVSHHCSNRSASGIMFNGCRQTFFFPGGAGILWLYARKLGIIKIIKTNLFRMCDVWFHRSGVCGFRELVSVSLFKSQLLPDF